ncbi:O-methyltransferase [Neobacillus muris]|uniref:O-methyltransferase n=1 Tax=Neobacillus muris TaxID=2941334 RepID=UPI00203B4B8D|nr:O-methyltransferase [Neobacillus muris]
MDRELKNFLKELERFGIDNDNGLTDKSKRMRNVTSETGEFLSFMISLTKSKNILEIGTSNGYSTLWMADRIAENEGLVTTLEYSPYKADLAKVNFEKANMTKWINLLVLEAGEYMKTLHPNSFDFIFLDSERKEYVEWWKSLKKILKKNGLIIVDNIISHYPELHDFIDLVTKEKDFVIFQLPIGSGLLLLNKK